MTGRIKKGLLLALIAIGIVLILLFSMAPAYVERAQNQVVPHPDWPVSARAQQLHASLRIADLHADTLLWDRNILERSARGHVDLPRLLEGNVAFQVLDAVTKSPRGQNYERNSSAAADNITLLSIVQLWPPGTWGSLLERALFQAGKLREAAESSDRLFIVTRSEELTDFLDAGTRGRVATVLGTEGAHPLQGEIGNLDRLWGAGYRVLGLHHFFDNALGGSLHGESETGLTDFGRRVVRKAVDMGFIIDVAHSSPAAVDDVLAITSRPFIVSHTGVKGVCNSPRNLSDERFQRIAAAGGLVGIGFWEGAVCDASPAGVARSIAYAVDLLGVDHVALGSDYDGATAVMFDVSELSVLTQALLDVGLSENAIRRIMGENQLRFFTDNLPRGVTVE